MMKNKSVVMILLSTLIASLIYSSYSMTTTIFVQGKPVFGAEFECDTDFFGETCCWWEDFGNYSAYVCQTCTDNGDGTQTCGALEKQLRINPNGEKVLDGGKVLDEPKTQTPTTKNDANVPNDGGALTE